MHPKRFNTRSTGLSAAFLAAAVSLALVATAAAVVYVYSNDFGSRSEFQEIDRTGGGERVCDDTLRTNAEVMRIAMRSKTFCEYSPPVTGDAGQPDHEIVAQGRILASSPKNVRKVAYLAVRVRAGEGDYYELRVTPKGGKYRLDRSPSGAGLPMSGQSNSINPLGERNVLRLRVTDGEVTGFVNGNSVVSFTDPNPGQVQGRELSFGIGSTKDADSGPFGTFTQVRVGVPTP